MNGSHTDLYQLTMAAGYFESGKTELRRRFLNCLSGACLKSGLSYCGRSAAGGRISAGIAIHGGADWYFESLAEFPACQSTGFWDYLRSFPLYRRSVRDARRTPFFPARAGCDRSRARSARRKYPETFLLAVLGHQSMIAAKAARGWYAPRGARSVIEFGTVAHMDAEAGVLHRPRRLHCRLCRDQQCGGRLPLRHPLYTARAAHSWVLAFRSDESESFRESTGSCWVKSAQSLFD